jgi:type 1 glutamine amidotransferase
VKRFLMLVRVVLLAVCASCSTGGTGPGVTGTGGATGTAGPGAAGASAVGAAGSGSGTTTGAAGAAPSGGAGTSATGAAGASATGAAGASASGSAGDVGGAAGTAGGAAGTSPSGGDAGAHADAGSVSDATITSHGNKVLIYTKSTGFVHDSTPVAADAIAKAATAAGLVPETSADTAKFVPATLAQYAAVVFVATAGEPVGSPGTMQIQTLVDFVNAGGGLVAIENANHAYDNSAAYVSLIGDDFAGHSGFGPDTCYKDGDHPTNMRLPAMFPVTDEIYFTAKYNMANQVVLRCGSDKRPISWVRQQGAGRVFYTALGHAKESWTSPPLVDGHVLPGLLWTMGRPVP